MKTLEINLDGEITQSDYLKNTILYHHIGEGDVMIASLGDDEYGIGNLIIVPYYDIMRIYLEHDIIKLRVNNTEGESEYSIIDMVFIGNIVDWAKEMMSADPSFVYRFIDHPAALN